MSESRREDDKEEASPEPDELPPEIIEEILIRLPAKSIGRFKCVSMYIKLSFTVRGYRFNFLSINLVKLHNSP